MLRCRLRSIARSLPTLAPSEIVRAIPPGKITWALAYGHWGDVLASLGFADHVRRAKGLDWLGILLLPTFPECAALVAAQPWVREVHTIPLDAQEFRKIVVSVNCDDARWVKPYAEQAGVPLAELALTGIEFPGQRYREADQARLTKPCLPASAYRAAERIWEAIAWP